MNRRLFFLSMSGLAGCALRSRPRLNVFNWSEYIAPDTLPNFEREFGVEVRYATYESAEEMLAKVWSGNSGWDVVFPANNFVGPMREQRLIAPLRREWLPGVRNLDGVFRQPPWDPKLEWSVPYMHSATGLVYNSREVPEPASWADFWQDRYRRRVTMLDDPNEVIGASLLKLGYRLNSSDPDQLRRARDEALAIKPRLRAYLNAEAREQLVAGDLLVAQAWGITAQAAIDANPALRFSYPAEGFALYSDVACILRESRRERLAHEFIDYLLRPEVSAVIASTNKTATCNGAAWRLLPETLRNAVALYPPAETQQRGQWFEPLPAAAQRLRDRLWTEIRSA